MRPSLLLRLLVLGMALLYLGTLIGITVGFADGLPAAAWAGFGIVLAVVAALAGATILLFERIDRRAGADRDVAAPRSEDARERLLVVADVGCEEADACEGIVSRLRRPSTADVLVVAPTIASPLHHVMDDEGSERVTAGRRLDRTVGLLRRRGIAARGMIGSDLPLEAMHDALYAFPADEIVILAPLPEESVWSEGNLLRRAETTFGRPVTHVLMARPDEERLRRQSPTAT